MTPATAFTKAVCERASKDGWGIYLYRFGWMWENEKKTHTYAHYCDDLRYQLFSACCDLQQREYPDLQVIID